MMRCSDHAHIKAIDTEKDRTEERATASDRSN
jgi:hypothetical protein